MTHVAMTGSNGFLGWHTRAAGLETGLETRRVEVGDRFVPSLAADAISGAARLVHIAGVNRAGDEEVYAGNLLFATQAAAALRNAERPPAVVSYANSTQVGNGSVYGVAKEAAADVLRAAAHDVGAHFEDIQLPNLFGEHGRPDYNAVTSTFCHRLAKGERPSVNSDKELVLLHAQDAADLLLGTVPVERLTGLSQRETVSGLLSRLQAFAEIYSAGHIPDISTAFARNLFNTYRSYAFEASGGIPLARHADARGSFFEIVRSHGGAGQSSFSTTAPRVSRGDHFHRRKVERFTVLAGTGTITLRKLFTQEIRAFEVDGEAPLAVDMPTMWTHCLENTGSEMLYTSFWTNDLFDPANPDTILERVQR